jgi:tRNA pseudouridine13 synthase
MSEPMYPLACEYAHGGPLIEGLLRASPADFLVDEVLGFEPNGDGEHEYLHIRKTGLNTAQLAKDIARLAGVKPMDVGYAGLKDRHAVTTQWLSVYRPKGEAVDWSQLQNEQVDILQVSRHQQKLRRGQHAANQFRLKIRECTGDFDSLEQRFQQIETQGVPNYFGLQRFGFGGGNLAAAQRLLVDKQTVKNRQLRGLYISAARSYLFNQVLRARIEEGSWLNIEDGDVASDVETNKPTGPLWGRGRLASGQRVGELETTIIEKFSDWCHGLEHAGLKQERRPLCLPVTELKWSRQQQSDNSNTIEVAFSLPVGGYATSVIREVVNYREPERGRPE